MTKTMNLLEYDGTDPDWWSQANGIQYKAVQLDTGAAELYMSHFPR